jgi:hypothetical protein
MRERTKDTLSLIGAGLLLMVMNAEGIARAAKFTVPEKFHAVSEVVSGSLVDVSRATGLYRVREAGESASSEMGLNTRTSEMPDGVLFLGDSVLEDVVTSFRRSAPEELPVSDVILRGSQLGDALWDWNGTAAKAARESRANTAVVMLDASETEPEGWRQYGELIDELRNNGVRQVVLLARPVSSDDRYEADRAKRIQQMREAAERRGAVFTDLSTTLMGTNGSFPDFVTGHDGVKVRVREKDGYHLTAGGADMFAQELMSVLGF